MPAKVLVVTPAAPRFEAFLRRNGIPNIAAARALGVAHPTVGGWIDCTARPDELRRRAIAKWTNGAIDEDMWLSDEERKYLAAIVPFRKGSVERLTA